MPYTFNGSIPSEPEDTRGWIKVSAAPPCPEGKEVVWLNWNWVVRDPKPENNEGNVWKRNHDQMTWVEYQINNSVVDTITIDSSNGV